MLCSPFHLFGRVSHPEFSRNVSFDVDNLGNEDVGEEVKYCASMLTFSTTGTFHPIYLLCSFADFHFGPATPGPIFDLLAEGQVPLAVGLYQLVAQSLTSVGLLDILDTELGF